MTTTMMNQNEDSQIQLPARRARSLSANNFVLFFYAESIAKDKHQLYTRGQSNRQEAPAQPAKRIALCRDKRDDFDFDIVNFPFLDGDVPRRASYGVYISQLIRFARVCNHVTDFNARNKSLTAKLLQQGYRYHKLRKTFSKFYRRHYELISKYNVGLKTLLSEGLSEPEFYGDLVYKFKKLIGSNDFSFQFRKIITRYRRIGYNLNVMRQSACLVFNPITVDNYAAFFNCTPVGRASDSMMAPT